MIAPDEPHAADESIRDAAARWAIRRDRGQSAAESIDFELWLAGDERHASAMRRTSSVWSEMDRVPESVAQEVRRLASRRRKFGRIVGALSLAAATIVIVSVTWKAQRPPATPVATSEADDKSPRTGTLADGTVVHLNAGTKISQHYTRSERRIRLLQGEAHFSVAKNAAWPFVVEARGVDVCAVGTAFNVSLQSATVEVLVTEGVVQLAAGARRRSGSRQSTQAPPLLNRGQKAIVTAGAHSASELMDVTEVSGDDMARALAWREPLLRLGGATLAEVVAAFESRTGRRIIMADPELASVRLGGRFRADDVEGFANLLEMLGIDVEHLPDGGFALRKKKAKSR